MGFFDLFRKEKAPRADINAVGELMKQAEGAVLLDVREASEYAEGHIPGSMNIPLGTIAMAGNAVPDKDTPVFVYCYSGKRSSKAARILKESGFTRVTDLGGIMSYRGTVER